MFLAPLRKLIQERFAYSSTGGAQDNREAALIPLRPIPPGESTEKQGYGAYLDFTEAIQFLSPFVSGRVAKPVVNMSQTLAQTCRKNQCVPESL